MFVKKRRQEGSDQAAWMFRVAQERMNPRLSECCIDISPSNGYLVPGGILTSHVLGKFPQLTYPLAGIMASGASLLGLFKFLNTLC